MGIGGYLGVVSFTFGLLVMIKSEVRQESEVLPSLIEKAVWTFSDSRHAEHRPMKGPSSNILTTARPQQNSPAIRLQRGYIVSILTLGITGSYILWYLSLRTFSWWIALSDLGIIWSSALYRATVSQNFLTATNDDVGNSEHWIGMFRNTVGESLLATLQNAQVRTLPVPNSENTTPSPNSLKDTKDYILVEKREILIEPVPDRTALFVVPSIRTALRTWSSAEDVMKVGLEMAKNGCKLHGTIKCESYPLSGPWWIRLVRFRLAIYVPGLVWKTRSTVDFALPKAFDLESLIRHVVKLLHVCMDHEGVVERHKLSPKTLAELSHVLCGPVADPPVDEDFSDCRPTLRTVLAALRDNKTNTNTTKFTLEQAILLPTIILSSLYER